MLVAAHEPRSLDDTRGNLIALQDQERGLLMGTPAYMRPSSFDSDRRRLRAISTRSACVAYQLFTGLSPAPSTSPRNKNPPPSSASGHTPRELDAPVMRLLEHSPNRRPHSARAAIAAIAAGDWAADGAGVARTRTSAAQRGRGYSPRSPRLAPRSGRYRPSIPLERAATDARFGMATPHPPNPAILLVVLDDASVDAEARPLGLWADEFGVVTRSCV